MNRAARARALTYLLIWAFLAVLLTFYTVRYTLGGIDAESVLLLVFSVVLWLQARSWYRRLRALREDQPVRKDER